MIGKKNIVFGFLFLVVTAALGPYMVIKLGGNAGLEADKGKAMDALRQLAAAGYVENQQPVGAERIARENTQVILAAEKAAEAEQVITRIKSGPHAHGNLESMLNIVVGVVLCFIAVSPLFKQAISWIFILGTLLHSGMLYLGVVFDQSWAWSAIKLGPPLILLGLLLMGVAAAIGFRGRLVEDR